MLKITLTLAHMEITSGNLEPIHHILGNWVISELLPDHELVLSILIRFTLQNAFLIYIFVK